MFLFVLCHFCVLPRWGHAIVFAIFGSFNCLCSVPLWGHAIVFVLGHFWVHVPLSVILCLLLLFVSALCHF